MTSTNQSIRSKSTPTRAIASPHPSIPYVYVRGGYHQSSGAGVASSMSVADAKMVTAAYYSMGKELLQQTFEPSVDIPNTRQVLELEAAVDTQYCMFLGFSMTLNMSRYANAVGQPIGVDVYQGFPNGTAQFSYDLWAVPTSTRGNMRLLVINSVRQHEVTRPSISFFYDNRQPTIPAGNPLTGLVITTPGSNLYQTLRFRVRLLGPGIVPLPRELRG